MSARHHRGSLGDSPSYLLPDLLEGRPTGRLLVHDPATGRTSQVLDALHFPNGGALTPDGDTLWIAESTRCRIRAYDLPTALGRELMGRLPMSLFVNEDDPLGGGLLELGFDGAVRRWHTGITPAPTNVVPHDGRRAARPAGPGDDHIVAANCGERGNSGVRMAELSERSGVPIPTIRYYQREGLLPAGRLTSPNQAVYDESHVRRLALVRAMVEVGEMPIAAVGALFRRLREKDADEYVTLGLTQYALVREPDQEIGTTAVATVDDLLTELGWEVRDQHPARAVLASTIATLHRLGRPELVALLRPYAQAAHQLAEREVPMVFDRDGLDERAETVVLVGVLGDAMLAALRKLAQEDVTSRALREQ